VADHDAPHDGGEHLDVAAEHERLEELEHRIEETRAHAHEDLDVGRKGRMFADAGTERQIEAHGDTTHPADIPPTSNGEPED
jgi:hypothetical protein